MEYKAAVATPDSKTMTETIHATLEDAVKAVVAGIDAHPELLTGVCDLALVTDTSDETAVMCVFRMGEEFVLARATTDERYADELYAMEHTRYESDWDPFMLFARWPAKGY